MSSKSLRAELRHRALLALILAAAGGCEREVTHVTPLQVVRLDYSESCIGQAGVNALSVEIMRYEGEPEASKALATECRRCAEGVPCPVIARRCLCVGTRHDIEGIVEALAGLRFDGISPDERLCARLVGISRPGAGGPDQGPGAACDEASCARTKEGRQARICGLSEVGSLSEAESPLVIRDFFCATLAALDALDCASLEKLCAARPELEFCGLFCGNDGGPALPMLGMTPWQCASAGQP